MTARIIENLPREQYDALKDRANWSRIKHLARSPLHYKHACETGGTDSAARKRGRAVHCAVLEPDIFAQEFVVFTGDKVRQPKEWKAFQREHAGREIIDSNEKREIESIAAAVRRHPIAAKYLARGKSEVTVLWEHEVYPGATVACRARLDWVGGGVLLDLKNTKDASPDEFGKQMARLGTCAQAAMYQDGWFAATGERPEFALVAVEAEAPHCVQVYRVEDIDLARGRAEYQRLLSMLWLCREEDRWPGYGDEVMPLRVPKWAQSEEVEFAHGETARAS